MLFAWFLTAIVVVHGAATDGSVYLVTGATGRTGSLIYQSLQESGYETRALVTDQEKAREVLNCTQCDETEGIYIGDVTDVDTLLPAFAGVTGVAIAVGVSGNVSEEVMAAVEWHGVQNQVEALATNANSDGVPLVSLRVALISSMGTTEPNPSATEGGSVLFWKLQAEAFLMSCGVPATIVKPCGLVNLSEDLVPRTLLVGHDDALLTSTQAPIVARTEVARVMTHALVDYPKAGLRMDLCSEPGPTTDDLDALLDSAKWAWQQ